MTNTKAIQYNNDIISDKRAVSAIGIIFFIVATMLGAYVRIPVPGTPVPITLQTLFVLLSGAVLGRKLGFLSMAGYIAFGGAALFGPTFGYLVGFMVTSYIIGLMLEKDFPALFTFVAGNILLLTCGAVWLICAYRMDPVSAFSLGVLPFVIGDAVKLAAALLIYSNISQRTKEIFGR